tara:strand:+ start:47 stop:601 length:555 start_codon:yes stop_codon:yes gene_type:complete
VRVKYCDVTIFKSIEVTIVKQIWEHEIPILETVFGDGNVKIYSKHEWHTPKDKKYQVMNKDPVVYKIEEIDYEEEYGRLQSAYGTRDGSENVPNVEYIYGRIDERRLEKMNNEKYASEYTAPDAYDEEVLEVELSDDMDYKSMTNRELKDLLNDLNVKYKPTATKAVLIDLLEKADKGELEIAN